VGGAAWGDGAGGLLVELVEEEVERVVLDLGEALEEGGRLLEGVDLEGEPA